MRRQRRYDYQADHGDRGGHGGVLCQGPGWLHHRLRRPSGPRLTTGCTSFASKTTRDQHTHTMSEIYISTDVETDGPIPGPHSMLSFGSAAYTADKTLVST